MLLIVDVTPLFLIVPHHFVNARGSYVKTNVSCAWMKRVGSTWAHTSVIHESLCFKIIMQPLKELLGHATSWPSIYWDE